MCPGSQGFVLGLGWHAPGRAGVRVYSFLMAAYDEPRDPAGEPGEDLELIRPEDFLAQDRIPADARRIGLDRNTEEGAMLAMAASLDPAKASHRLVAWVLLAAFVGPLLLGVTRQLF